MAHVGHRHLVRPPVTFRLLTIDLLRARPTLGTAENNHWPQGTLGETIFARVGLNGLDLADDTVESARQELVHILRVVPFDKIWRVAVAAHQRVQFLVADAGEHRGIGDLIAV